MPSDYHDITQGHLELEILLLRLRSWATKSDFSGFYFTSFIIDMWR